jgi:twinkle protein
LELYDIRTKVGSDGRPLSVGFPYPDGRVKVRGWDEKEFRWEPKGETRTVGLFGRDKFPAGSNEACIITEGEYDAPSCNQVLHIPAVSVVSAVTAARDVAVDRSWVDSHQRIYLAFDADAAGRAARDAVARLFDSNKLYVLDLYRDGRKDSNDYLKAGEGDVLLNIFKNAKRYLPETVISINRDTVSEILSETVSPGVPYPFRTLTEMTNGGMRRGQSVLIKALEGVGKTELMHALEYQLLQETDDNVAAIFIEEPKRDHLQALASYQLGRTVVLQGPVHPNSEVLDAIQGAVKTDDRLHLYNHFGTDDPDVLSDTIRTLCAGWNVRWVLLDHIGMVVSGMATEKDERRTLDYLTTKLEMLVKELDFGLIFVSHVNDEGQTRGSRYIGKTANIIIKVERDVKAGSNIINFTLEKNRPPLGKTGPAGSYLFDPYTKRYTEVDNSGDDNGRFTYSPPLQPKLGEDAGHYRSREFAR